MQKKKDGTVVASLTEVKNKTGDIFALADEYGEVLLTSYNKPRYKIVKLNVSESLTLTEEKDSTPKVRAVKSEKPKAAEPVKEVEIEAPAEKANEIPENAMQIIAWNRDSDKEWSFAHKATKGLL